MKRFAIASLFVSTALVACGEKAPAPAAPAPVALAAPKAVEPKPEEKPAEAAEPTEKPAEPAEAAEPTEKPAEAAEPAEPTEKPAEAVEQAEIPAVTKNWRVFAPEEGSFTIRAPGQPETMPQETETEIGVVTYVNHMFSLPEGMLMVAWADLPLDAKEITSDVEKKMFDGGRDSMVKAIKAKLIEEKTIELDGFPGRSYLMEIEVPDHGKAYNLVRTFLAGNRHYTLQGLGMSNGSKDAQIAFLDSFHITKKADAPSK